MLLPTNRPALMGILNVTPDSFSDGGLHFDRQTAVDAAMRMVEDGADLVDVGGESTRPGADAITLDEELHRVIPVVEILAKEGIAVSIDTMKPEVARQALQAGTKVVNDVTALSDPLMRTICANHRCTVCLMHMKGDPRTMQMDPIYPHGVVAEVNEFLHKAAEQAQREGIDRNNIWLDPGIGFGKTMFHNLELIRSLGEIAALGYPVLIGVSRKSFIGRITGTPESPTPVDDRLEGTLAIQVLAQAWGAKIIRAHDVKAARRAIDVAATVLR